MTVAQASCFRLETVVTQDDGLIARVPQTRETERLYARSPLSVSFYRL
jgi:hypothetical protein